MRFDNFVYRFDEGQVGPEQIDELLLIVHPTDEAERQARRDRVIIDGKIIKFQAVALNRQANQVYEQRAAEATAPQAAPQPITDLSPELAKDIPDEVYDRPDYVPQIKSRVGIVQAVRTWGKPQNQIKDNRTEGVKVRCPFSHHTDNVPSAWVNTAENIWYCGKCTVGGDVIDFFAAAKHDLQPSEFHRSPRFHKIIEEMAEELGIQIVSTSDGGFVVEAKTESWKSNLTDRDDQEEPVSRNTEPTPTTIVEQTPEGPISYDDFFEPSVPASAEASEPVTVTVDDVLRGVAVDDEIDEDELFEFEDVPSFDWRELGVPENTFLHSWMVQAEEELPWVPIEFFLGLGLQAIGISCGHTTTSRSFGLTLTGSTLAVVIGSTASGKSTATNRLRDLVNSATGAKWDPQLGSGVKLIPSVASAEALTKRVKTEIAQPTDPTVKVEVPANVWYYEDELAQLISRSKRAGGEHIKQRIMRFHDFSKKKSMSEPEVAAEDFSLTNGYNCVHDTYFTGTFLTQNQSVRELVEKKDLVSGFFNRMIFIMGHTDVPRLMTGNHYIDPDPGYIKLYERMWKDCQLKERVIPFSDDAMRLVDSHPLNQRLGTIAAQSDMFARWQMMMLRFAFLLAVNENSPLIEERHVNASFNFVSSYLIPCAASMVSLSKPEVGEKNLLGDRIVEWLGGKFDREGAWPETRKLRGHRMWCESDAEIRKRTLDLLHHEQRVVQVTLIEGPWGTGERSVLVLPEGDFVVYADSHQKKYKYADFYENRTTR